MIASAATVEPRRRVQALVTFVAVGMLVVSFTACQPTDYSKCPVPTAGQVRVAVVVDARSLGGKTTVVCVVVATGSNGVTALRARATRLGTAQPRFGTAGLLCAIDGKPAEPACGETVPTGYAYWSYWLGGASWLFAPVGPGTRTVQDKAVDGWRFIPGGPNQPPETASSFTELTGSS